MKPGPAAIRLEVWDDELIVTLPGTLYAVTYYKPPNAPQLLARDFPYKDDSRADLSWAGLHKEGAPDSTHAGALGSKDDRGVRLLDGGTPGKSARRTGSVDNNLPPHLSSIATG